MIEIIDLKYKDILKKINVQFPTGIIFLKGKNGAGKSTLLDCICGLNREYSGQIHGNESILYLNQNFYFDYRLKCRDFVNFVTELENIKITSEEFFCDFPCSQQKEDIEKLWKTPIGMLSGGERAKIFFHIISFIDREWYVLDEPFSGVDEDGIFFMKKRICQLEKNGKGVIITSHEKSVLDELPIKKIYIMEKGILNEFMNKK
ncbi:MAG: ATP-binding cassette domain-containing protein [Lachnospiraceae bacterium]